MSSGVITRPATFRRLSQKTTRYAGMYGAHYFLQKAQDRRTKKEKRVCYCHGRRMKMQAGCLPASP